MQTNKQPSAATCNNGYIYDSTCDECATKGLAATKDCYELHVSIIDRIKRCDSCEHMYVDELIEEEGPEMLCEKLGTYCRDINSCTDYKKLY